MRRCDWCDKFVWPWQSRGPRLLGGMHYACYRQLYATLATSHLPLTGRAFWDAVLMAPPDISAELLRRHDEASALNWKRIANVPDHMK